MYNIYFRSDDGKTVCATLNSTVTAQHVHDTLVEAGYDVLTERPH